MKGFVHKITVKKNAPILEALKVINEGGAQIALVLCDEGEMVGVVTDGDVRRGLIRGASLEDPVESIMNSNPSVYRENVSVFEIKKDMNERKIAQAPIVNFENKVVDIILSEKMFRTPKRSNMVVIMAGGLGSRLGDLTRDCPKPMLKIKSRPILHEIILQLKSFGFYRFVLSLNYKASIIKDYFKSGEDLGIEISYINEKQKMGTAGSLSLVNVESKEPVLVMNGDVLTKVDFSQLLDYHEKAESVATMCAYKYRHQIPYGVVNTQFGKITSIEEKPIHESLVNAGIYMLDPRVLEMVPQDTYFDMPSLFQKIIKKYPEKVNVFPIYEYWIDIGHKGDFHKAESEYDGGSEW